MNKPNWDEAPEGATHWGPKSESGWVEAFYKKSPEGKWLKSTGDAFGGRWHGNASLNEDWPERLASLVRHPTAWTGEGLPPVGLEVEFSYKGTDQGTGIVLFYGTERCLIRNTSKGMEREQSGDIRHYEFRPIRTPELIAAEEREWAIKDMLTATRTEKIISRRAVCELLYDAGYRKK